MPRTSEPIKRDAKPKKQRIALTTSNKAKAKKEVERLCGIGLPAALKTINDRNAGYHYLVVLK